MALLDQVKKSLTSGFELPQFGQSEKIKELQAATAGRALLGEEGGPKQGSQAEMIAAAGAQAQRQEDILQGEMAAAGLEQQQAEQEQQFQQKQKLLDEESLNIRQQNINKTQEILQDFFQRKGEIDFREQSARAQYAIAAMRMSNDDYLDQLEVQGARSRLEDQMAFDWELTRSVFDEEISIFKNNLDFKRVLNAEDREFREYMAEFNLEQALALSQIDIETAETKAKYEAAGQLVSTGGKAISAAYAKPGLTDTFEDTVDLEDTVLTDDSTAIGTRELNTDERTIEIPSLIKGGRVNPDDTFF